jgi:hypothetical protein
MYRVPFKTEKPKEPYGGFKYILVEEHQVTNIFYNHYCTVCKTMNTSVDGLGFCDASAMCIPNKRVTFKNKFWQKKKFCPLDGYHKHYHCHYCGVASILALQSDKIISSEFNEDT